MKAPAKMTSACLSEFAACLTDGPDDRTCHRLHFCVGKKNGRGPVAGPLPFGELNTLLSYQVLQTLFLESTWLQLTHTWPSVEPE